MNGDWNEGDSCVAVYYEDGLEYSARILRIHKSEEGEGYAEIQFDDYGNTETVWLENLIKRAYRVGEECRIVSREDGSKYEAVVEDLEDEGRVAVVKLAGYGNFERVSQEFLLPSLGKEAQKAQEFKAESADQNNNTDDVSNVTLNLVEGSTMTAEDFTNVTLHPTEDVSNVTLNCSRDTTLNNCSSLRGKAFFAKQDMGWKQSLVSELEKCKKIQQDLEAEHRSLQKRFDEDRVRTSALEDENKLLSLELEKTRRFSEEELKNLRAKLRIDRDENKISDLSKSSEMSVQELIKIREEYEADKRELTTKVMGLTRKISELETSNGSLKALVDEYKERCQILGVPRLKVGGSNLNGSDIGDTKPHSKESNDETIVLERSQLEDSYTIGSNHMVPMPAESRNQVAILLNSSPLTVGQLSLQPILCYIPVAQPGQVSPNETPSHSSSPSLKSTNTSTNGFFSEAPMSDHRSQQLRRPLSSTASECIYPSSSTKLSIVSKEPAGSASLVEEIEGTKVDILRLNKIFEDLRPELTSLIGNEYAHKVIVALLNVGPYNVRDFIIREVWEHFIEHMETCWGVTVILKTVDVMPPHGQFLEFVRKPLMACGVSRLSTMEDGCRVVCGLIERLQPLFILDSLKRDLEKLLMDGSGFKVIVKAILCCSHELVSSIMDLVILKAKVYEGYYQGMKVIEAIVYHHISNDSAEDGCLKKLSTCISVDLREVFSKKFKPFKYIMDQ